MIAALIGSLDLAAVPKALRTVAEDLLQGAHDNKKAMRERVLSALEEMVAPGGTPTPGAVDAFGPAMCTALQNPVGRSDLLSWLAVQVERGEFHVTKVSGWLLF